LSRRRRDSFSSSSRWSSQTGQLGKPCSASDRISWKKKMFIVYPTESNTKDLKKKLSQDDKIISSENMYNFHVLKW
jgi:hypothetical protein